MKKIKISFLLLALVVSCNRKVTPTISYIDNTTTKYDTIVLFTDGGVDTIFSSTPCDSFSMVVRKTDTIYIRQIKKEIQTKLITKHDTIYRTPVITQNIIKNKGQIGNENINSKTKKGDNITGDGNTITKPVNKGDKFWLGVLCATAFLYLLGFGLSVIEKYVPVAGFVVGIIRRFLPNGQ